MVSKEPAKKSKAQIKREVDEILARTHKDSRHGDPPPTHTKKPPRRARATKTKTSGKTSDDKLTIDQLAEMFGLPAWDKIDEMNQQHYWEMARGAEGEEAQLEAEREAQDEVYRQWYDAVEHVAEKLFGEHGLELLAMKHTRKIQPNYRPHQLKVIPSKSWSDAADKIRETINGVGTFHFDDLREFLDSGPYTARQAVLAHLRSMRSYPAVYDGPGAHQMYEQHWR